MEATSINGFSAGDDKREGFYTRLRARITDWLDCHTDTGEPVRSYLLLLPDLVVLMIRLISDRRVSPNLKAELIATMAYAASPVDLIPDAALPLGLIDDAFAVIVMLTRLVSIMGQPGEAILREHWEGDRDVLEQLHKFAQTASTVLSSGLLRRLSGIFGKAAATAAGA